MVYEEVEAKAKGAKAFATWTYSPTTLNLNSNKNNGAPNGKKGTGLPKEKHDLNKRGLMVRKLLRLVHATNVLPKVPPNHPKETLSNQILVSLCPAILLQACKRRHH
jgi:hypothetical protein